MSVKFEFSGSWDYDGHEDWDAQDLALYLRERYGENTIMFLKRWNCWDQITVTVDGEKVFGP